MGTDFYVQALGTLVSYFKMDELWDLHANAQDIDIVSAEQIGKYDTTVYRMGGLLITAVFLKDVGLIG